MARLGPKMSQLTIGSGGVPELSPQDIAAALGMVENRLGRELLCLMWWPDSMTVSIKQIQDLLESEQRAEWWKGEQGMLDAMLAVASHTGGESLRRAQRMYADAHAARWPHWVDSAELGTHSEGYERLRLIVLAEIRAPSQCAACAGRKTVRVGAVIRDCEVCEGTGRQSISNRTRAALLKVNESVYRRSWQKVFEWTMDRCVDAMIEAERQMKKAVA
ncbi:hypothetical protein [Dyella mobilis]|nr:hypothetical protein [Dyella mobilis]GLQ96454.1 hypothetical protein GCM10007863_08720 [Dyella mobilis]